MASSGGQTSSSSVLGVLEEKVRRLREKVEWERVRRDVDGGGEVTFAGLLRDALDALRPERSRVWRDNALEREGSDRASAYAWIQKAAVGLVTKDFVHALTSGDAETPVSKDVSRECFLLLIETGRGLAEFIDRAQGKGENDGGGGDGETDAAQACAQEFRSFAALNACWSAAAKLLPTVANQGAWHSSASEEEEARLLQWLLRRVSKETASYVDSGGDKRLFHVLKFWYQTFNKFFCFEGFVKSGETAGALSALPRIIGEDTVQGFHSMCTKVIQGMQREDARGPNGGRKVEGEGDGDGAVVSWSHDLRTKFLVKILPFSSFLFHRPCHAPGAPNCGEHLIKACLYGGSGAGICLLVEVLAHHERRLDPASLNLLASSLPAVVSGLATKANRSCASMEDRATKMLMTTMMQCLRCGSAWKKAESSVLKVLTGTTEPNTMRLVLEPWIETLKHALSESKEKMVRDHLMVLIGCMHYIAPSAVECRKSMLISEQLAMVVCALVQQRVVTKAMLKDAFEKIAKGSEAPNGLGLSKLAARATKLCLFQCSPTIISAAFAGSQPCRFGESAHFEEALFDCAMAQQDETTLGKRKRRSNCEGAMSVLETLHTSKRSKVFRRHAATCAFEVLERTLDALCPGDVKRLDSLLSRFMRTADCHLERQHIVRIIGKLPIDAYHQKYFHHFLRSKSIFLVHLAMDALVVVLRKLHDLGKDFYYLVPRQVFDRCAAAESQGDQAHFVQSLSQHMKRPAPAGTNFEESAPSQASAHLETREWKDLPWANLRSEPSEVPSATDAPKTPRAETPKAEISRLLHQAESLIRSAGTQYTKHRKDLDLPHQGQGEAIANNLNSILSELTNLKNQVSPR